MPNEIYQTDEVETIYSKSNRLLALARIGIAASDTSLNIDLHQGGYTGLFETIALLADEVSDGIDEIETTQAHRISILQKGAA